MKRFLSGARKERGATLTGYALLMSGIVVVSLGAIEAVNQSSQTVLGETAVSVGTPRPSVSDTKTGDVGSAPPWVGSRGDGFCTAGLDGCPLGTQMVPFTPTVPTQNGGAPNVPASNNLTTLYDPDPIAGVYIIQESQVRMNGEWTPPDGDKPSQILGFPAAEDPITVQPGDIICSYIIHVSGGSGNSVAYESVIDFPGEIIGTAFDESGGENNRLGTNETFGSTDINLPGTARLGNNDKFEYSGNTLTLGDLNTNNNGKDELRVFTRC